jgi:hypothetical protein
LADRYDRLHVCFEAGPMGYGLYRQVQALGQVGPSLAASLGRSSPKNRGPFQRVPAIRAGYHPPPPPKSANSRADS